MSQALREAITARAGRSMRWPSWLRRATQPATQTLFVQRDAAWTCTTPSVRFDNVAAWMENHAGTPVRLVLSSRLLHHLVLRDPALPLHDDGAVAAYARHQFVHYHGSVAQHWPVATWHEADQRGASALHGLDMPALLACSERQRVTLLSMAPWWSLALRRADGLDPGWARSPCAGLVLVEGCWITCLTLEAGKLTAIEQRPLDAPTASAVQAAAAEWLAEDSLRQTMTLRLMGYGLAPSGDLADFSGDSMLQLLGPASALHAAHPGADGFPP